MTADGLANPLLARGAPYDLIIANILAGPLTRLAPIQGAGPRRDAGAVGPAAEPGNAGDQLLPACALSARRRDGPWSALVLEKPSAVSFAHGPALSRLRRLSDPPCAPRLAALRAELAKRGLDGFVVPHSDQHMDEYLPAMPNGWPG